MREKTFYVYKIICTKDEWNGKFYIGSHYGYVDDIYTGSGRKIKEYFKLYRKDKTYKKEILEISDNEIYIKNKEKEIIRENIENDLCLNIVVHSAKSTAGKLYGMYGKTHTEESKQKMSKAGKGRKFSEEHRRKISESQKGRRHTKESIQKMCENHKGMEGKKHSEETKQKMREAWKRRKAGITSSPEC